MGTINLQWAADGIIDSYSIYRDTAPINPESLPEVLATGVLVKNYQDTAVVDGVTYYYRVASLSNSASKISDEVSVKAVAGDEHWDKVVALLHFDGVNNDTVFNDETGKIWTATSNLKTKTNQKVFGSASGLFDGNSYLKSASIDFYYGTDDFTWECFVRFNMIKLNQYIIEHNAAGAGNGGTISYYDGSLRYYNYTTGINNPLYTSNIPLNVNEWYHIAAVRHNSVTTIYVNGVAKSSGADNHNYVNVEFWIGSYSLSNVASFDGYIDELRITKGIARYTANFTPPDAPFPNS